MFIDIDCCHMWQEDIIIRPLKGTHVSHAEKKKKYNESVGPY